MATKRQVDYTKVWDLELKKKYCQREICLMLGYTHGQVSAALRPKSIDAMAEKRMYFKNKGKSCEV